MSEVSEWDWLDLPSAVSAGITQVIEHFYDKLEQSERNKLSDAKRVLERIEDRARESYKQSRKHAARTL